MGSEVVLLTDKHLELSLLALIVLKYKYLHLSSSRYVGFCVLEGSEAVLVTDNVC